LAQVSRYLMIVLVIYRANGWRATQKGGGVS